MKFTIAWGVVSAFFGLHLLIIFLIGLRFVTPYATEARLIQHTIQLTPRLSEPTLVTAVLVEQNVPVKKGTPLFQFDRRPYQLKVQQLEAQLAKAKQDVRISKADVVASAAKVKKLKSELTYAKYQQKLSARLAKQGAGPEEDAQKWAAQVAANEAGILEAQADEQRARLRATSDIGGVNTNVAAIEAELGLARFYLDNTLMVAPEDGYIINLQVRPGMVAGEVRFGAIASFIVSADRYPGQIWTGRVDAIWQGSGAGQMLPSGVLPNFNYVPAEVPQGQFAVVIRLDDPEQSKFPIGMQGRATIFTNPDSPFVWMRKIGIRAYSWFNWIYPFSG